MKPSRDIYRLIEIMAALRNPDGGCPWDLEQNFETIAPYTAQKATRYGAAAAEKVKQAARIPASVNNVA